MNYKKYLNEYIEHVEHSDIIPSSDNYMYSNAKAIDLYGQGKRFQIEDNIIFYEIVKIVKDVIDRHYYPQQVQFFIQIADKVATFTFIIERNDAKYTYFVETLYMFISNQIFRKFGDFFTIRRENDLTEDNKVILKIIVKKTETQTQED